MRRRHRRPRRFDRFEPRPKIPTALTSSAQSAKPKPHWRTCPSSRSPISSRSALLLAFVAELRSSLQANQCGTERHRFGDGEPEPLPETPPFISGYGKVTFLGVVDPLLSFGDLVGQGPHMILKRKKQGSRFATGGHQILNGRRRFALCTANEAGRLLQSGDKVLMLVWHERSPVIVGSRITTLDEDRPASAAEDGPVPTRAPLRRRRHGQVVHAGTPDVAAVQTHHSDVDICGRPFQPLRHVQRMRGVDMNVVRPVRKCVLRIDVHRGGRSIHQPRQVDSHDPSRPGITFNVIKRSNVNEIIAARRRFQDDGRSTGIRGSRNTDKKKYRSSTGRGHPNLLCTHAENLRHGSKQSLTQSCATGRTKFPSLPQSNST